MKDGERSEGGVVEREPLVQGDICMVATQCSVEGRISNPYQPEDLETYEERHSRIKDITWNTHEESPKDLLPLPQISTCRRKVNLHSTKTEGQASVPFFHHERHILDFLSKES